MKRILLLALIALSSNAWAGPKGTVKISVARSEIVLVNKNYEWVITTLCEETLPIEVVNGPAPNFNRSQTCSFVEKGITYHADTYHLAAITNFKQHDRLGFSSFVYVYDDNFRPLPFVTPGSQSFFTKELNLKNALMLLIPDQAVSCPNSPQNPSNPMIPLFEQAPIQENCMAINPLGISATFEYDIN